MRSASLAAPLAGSCGGPAPANGYSGALTIVLLAIETEPDKTAGMTAVGEAAARPAAGLDPRAARFLGTVLLVSFGPWLLPLLPWPTHTFNPPAIDLINVLTVVNIMHVGMTGFFWIDRRYRRHIVSRPRWFYVLPTVVATLSFAALAWSWWGGFLALTAASTAWLLYHFAKQNWGLLCLCAAATRASRPQPWERRLYLAGAAAGVIGMKPLAATLSQAGPQIAGVALVSVVGLIALGVALRRSMQGAHPALVLLTVYSGLYFAPIFLFGPVLGTLMIGTGHAFQYVAIMSCLAADGDQGDRRMRIAGLLLCGLSIAPIFTVLNYASLWGVWSPLFYVAFLGIQAWHFIIDADVWRLREPFQRQTLRESMPYLFA